MNEDEDGIAHSHLALTVLYAIQEVAQGEKEVNEAAHEIMAHINKLEENTLNQDKKPLTMSAEKEQIKELIKEYLKEHLTVSVEIDYDYSRMSHTDYDVILKLEGEEISKGDFEVTYPCR